MKALLLLIFILSTTMNYGQSIPTEEELHAFLNGKQLMITYREGEALYGTYYFIEVHYCPNGYYGLYANTIKRTVLGNEQKGGWQEYGQWQVQNRQGQVGIFYLSTAGVQQFIPIYKLPNGDFFVREGVTIVKKGDAICTN